MTKISPVCALTLALALGSCQSQVPDQPEPRLAVESATPTSDELTVPATEATGIASSPATQALDSEPTAVIGLQLELADPEWNGERIPKGQQCLRERGENPSTPRMRVANIPLGTDAIVLEFSDRDYGPMDNGGHGKVGFEILEGTSETIIPSIPGHTFDLPGGFFLIQEHQAPNFDTAGAYMPPCSGGADHSYYVTVKAVELLSLENTEVRVLDEGILELGKY